MRNVTNVVRNVWEIYKNTNTDREKNGYRQRRTIKSSKKHTSIHNYTDRQLGIQTVFRRQT